MTNSTTRYEVPGAMLNAQNINISQTVPGFPQLPGGVPGLNIYFVVRYVARHFRHVMAFKPSGGGKFIRQ